MGLRNYLYHLKCKLSKNMYQCNNANCQKYFNINDRFDDIKAKMPSNAQFADYGMFLGFCSDECCTFDNDMQNIVDRFSENA